MAARLWRATAGIDLAVIVAASLGVAAGAPKIHEQDVPLAGGASDATTADEPA